MSFTPANAQPLPHHHKIIILMMSNHKSTTNVYATFTLQKTITKIGLYYKLIYPCSVHLIQLNRSSQASVHKLALHQAEQINSNNIYLIGFISRLKFVLSEIREAVNCSQSPMHPVSFTSSIDFPFSQEDKWP